MTIILDLAPEDEAELNVIAAQKGQNADTVAAVAVNTYSGVVSDQADADVDRIYLKFLRVSLAQASAWQAGYEAALVSLTFLPNRCPKARDGDSYPNVVRPLA